MFWFVVVYAIIFQRIHGVLEYSSDSGTGTGTGSGSGSGGASGASGAGGVGVKSAKGFESTLQAVYTFSVLLFTLDNYHDVEDVMQRTVGSDVCAAGDASTAACANASLTFEILRVMAFYFFLVIGCIFLLSLVLGVTYEAYESRTKRQVKSEHVKELQGLTKAFDILDEHNTGFLTRKRWSLLLLKLRPGYTAYKIFLLYDICSGFSTR
jgi:hypothetical protein